MISVFTPLTASGNPYIEAAWETLKAQTLQDFEWVVLENHGGALPEHIKEDPRVRVTRDPGNLQGIGAIKRRCCELATGDFLLELDHDDLLHETALEKAVLALATADFAYSDTAEFRVDCRFDLAKILTDPDLSADQNAQRLADQEVYQSAAWLPNTYGAEYGWKTYPVTFQGHELQAHVQPPATPQNIRRVEWSPNHFRAWRKAAYWAVGGHNPELPVIDDHDLIVRMFLSGLTFKHVPECLYFYRVHGGNTVARDNALIQRLTQNVYDQNIYALAEKFARDGERRVKRAKSTTVSKGLKLIDLCGAIDTAPGYEPLDISLGHNLDKKWPLEDHSVGVIRAHDAIEHLRSPIHTLNEAYRVLAPGGFLLIRVPSTTGPMIRTPIQNTCVEGDGGEFHWVASAGRGAFQDPTHVSFWNENSFWYYTKSSFARYLKGMKARFQVIRLRTFYPDDFHQEHAIPYVEAHLVALKDGYEPMGIVEI